MTLFSSSFYPKYGDMEITRYNNGYYAKHGSNSFRRNNSNNIPNQVMT